MFQKIFYVRHYAMLLNVILPNVILPNVILPNVILPNAILLNVILLNVVRHVALSYFEQTCMGESFMLPQSLQQPTLPPPFDDGAGEDDRLVELSV